MPLLYNSMSQCQKYLYICAYSRQLLDRVLARFSLVSLIIESRNKETIYGGSLSESSYIKVWIYGARFTDLLSPLLAGIWPLACCQVTWRNTETDVPYEGTPHITWRPLCSQVSYTRHEIHVSNMQRLFSDFLHKASVSTTWIMFAFSYL